MSSFKRADIEMVSDSSAMTITVGSRTFNKPDLFRRMEWDFDIKSEICAPPPGLRDTKDWHKFYAAKLGPRFNFRFFAANYWLWLGNCMTERTANMLRYEGKQWHRYDSTLVQQAHGVLPYINEAERDGLLNLVPVIIAHEAPPQVIRSTIGRGAWRRAANNSVTRNVLIMNALRRCGTKNRSENFIRLLEFPSGVMRGVVAATDDEMIAARITPRKRPQEFQHTLHLIRDTRRMVDDFNPQWGYRRMREEHERATRDLLLKRHSDKKFTDDWAYAEKGYTATLLTSKADIATEGAVQHHCVASYAGYAAKGDYAVFRIEGKERATAGIRTGLVDQVYGACNARVSDDCVTFARKVATRYTTERLLALQAA